MQQPSQLSTSRPRGVLDADPFATNAPYRFPTTSSFVNVSENPAKGRVDIKYQSTPPSPPTMSDIVGKGAWDGRTQPWSEWKLGGFVPDMPLSVTLHRDESSPLSLAASPPSINVQMDAYMTPPTLRIRPAKSSLAGRQAATSKPLPTPIQTAHLLGPAAPLTPPLTPPFTTTTLSSIPPPITTQQYSTASSRALDNYRLHPLFSLEYTLHEELGCGGFGFVVRATRHSDNWSVAVKFIEREKIPQHGWAHTTAAIWERPIEGRVVVHDSGRLRIPMEAYVLAAINLEGVVAFIDLFEDTKYFYLVMEHHGSPWEKPIPPPPVATRPSLGASLSFTAIPPRQVETPTSSPIMTAASLPSPQLSPPRPAPMMRRSSCDLFECIEQNMRFDEDTARFVFAQIVEVVYALGRMGICHRDIKDENIVISNDLKVKLIDFGSAVIFDPNAPLPVYNRFYGTTAFASSEILKGQTYQAPSSEVWSLGVLLSILLTGECPFSDERAAAEGRISPRRVHLGFEVENLLRACLEVDPTKRATIAEVRNSRWLRGLNARRQA